LNFEGEKSVTARYTWRKLIKVTNTPARVKSLVIDSTGLKAFPADGKVRKHGKEAVVSGESSSCY
jgi:hypothetical protein